MTFYRLGILGHPVAHSRSPGMHAAALAAAGLEGCYERYDVPPEDLARRLDELCAAGVRGLNVTLPHKQAVLPLLDSVDPAARRIGAVNTITIEGGRRHGSNTDAPGLVRSLAPALSVEGRRVLVLGAGGAARAATVGLTEAGAKVWAAARRQDAAEALPDIERAVPWDRLADAFAHTELLVQATSATMGSGGHAQAFADALPLEALPDSAVVIDLVYTPLRTTLLERAASRGLRTVDGLGMLVHQGALSFEAWTGTPADVAAMRAALSRSA